MRAPFPRTSGLLAAAAFAALLSLPVAFRALGAEMAPGYHPLPYEAPTPGSYTLSVIGTAGDGKVLDTTGSETTLHAAFRDRIVVLSFIYTTCDDINGCPLAMTVLQKLKGRLLEKPERAGRVRLVTLSFNPRHDTPDVIRRYAEDFERGGIDWQFLTTRGEAELRPILDAYRQSVEKEVDAGGGDTARFSHLLRVYLIDSETRIRNVYTASVLHPDLVLADIDTLLHEHPGTMTGTAALSPAPDLLRAGDAKTDYESSDYRTRSVALTSRRGTPADLLALARKTPLGLPPVSAPPDNPLTADKVALGRKLFYDRRLSLNDTFSCAMCHIPEQGFASQEQSTAIGIEGRTVRRNAPMIYNVGYLKTVFHDGRESTLENQVWGALLAANEMGNPSIGFVVDKLKRLHDYRGVFEQAFGRGPTMETIGQALASYERTVVSGNSPFDRWYFGQDNAALSEQAKRGFELFQGAAGCTACHTLGRESALFTDQRLHNTGIGYRQSMEKRPATQRVQVAPGLSLDVDTKLIAQVAEAPPADLGRYEITQKPADRWKYKTPSLRNVALTAPYMHDGSLRTLREVLDFYNRGGVPNEGLDPALKPLNLEPEQVDALVAFLESLTGDSVETLVLDAYAAPVGDRE